MKSKVLKILLSLILFSTLLITVSNASTTVKENFEEYNGDVYIIGSTRFDSNVLLTANRVAQAAVNETKLNIALGKDISNLKIKNYYYDGIFGDIYELSDDGTLDELTASETAEVKENLNIFFVNNQEKVLEYKYEGTVDNGSVSGNVKYENNTFYVPATTLNFEFTSNGETKQVTTKVEENTNNEAYGQFEIIPNGAVIKVNNNYYNIESVAQAIMESNENQEAVLLEDITVDTVIAINSDETMNAVLNLNGKTLTGNGSDVIKLTGKDISLTIKNGNIRANGYAAVAVGKAKVTDSKAVLNIEKDVKVTGDYYGVFVAGESAIANIYGQVEVLAEEGYAVSGNGSSGYEGTEINIYDGAKITAVNNSLALYLPQEGVTNIYGGTITGSSAIAIKSGELNVKGGNLNAVGAKVELPGETNNGVLPTGDVIYVESNANYAGNVKVNIEAGNLNSTNSEIIRVYKSNTDRDIIATGLYTKATTSTEGKVVVYTK